MSEKKKKKKTHATYRDVLKKLLEFESLTDPVEVSVFRKNGKPIVENAGIISISADGLESRFRLSFVCSGTAKYLYPAVIALRILEECEDVLDEPAKAVFGQFAEGALTDREGNPVEPATVKSCEILENGVWKIVV